MLVTLSAPLIIACHCLSNTPLDPNHHQHQAKPSSDPTRAMAYNSPSRQRLPPCFNAQMPSRNGWPRMLHLTHPSLSRCGLDGPRRSRTCHTPAHTPHHHTRPLQWGAMVSLLGLAGRPDVQARHITRFSPGSAALDRRSLCIHVARCRWTRFRIQ